MAGSADKEPSVLPGGAGKEEYQRCVLPSDTPQQASLGLVMSPRPHVLAYETQKPPPVRVVSVWLPSSRPVMQRVPAGADTIVEPLQESAPQQKGAAGEDGRQDPAVAGLLQLLVVHAIAEV